MRLWASIVVTSLAVLPQVAANATPLDEMIEPEKDHSACFTRTYDAAQLRLHPKLR
jgi:hypothetical protein